MQPALRLLWPATLKYKLFFAVLLIVLLPFSIMQMYHFRKMESLIENQLSRQNQEQITFMKNSIEGVKEAVFKTLYIFEGDRQVSSVLQTPWEFEQNERRLIMDEKIRYIKENFLPSNIKVSVTIADLKGNAYTSYMQNEPLAYNKLAEQSWFAETISSEAMYRWETDALADGKESLAESTSLLTLYAPLKGRQQSAYAVLKIGIDYYDWIKSISRDFPLKQDYFILSKEGDVLSETTSGGQLPPAVTAGITASAEGSGTPISRVGSSLIHSNYIPSLQWFLVSKFHLELFIGDIEAMKRNFVITLVVMTAVFILFTLLLSLRITRPLSLLQLKMSRVVSSNFKTQLPEANQSGELLAVAQSFNRMVADLNGLVEQLKIEERQKEALRFQMLLSQMNPHFLLNTLNTIKLVVLLKEEESVPKICEALGKLLETGMNTQMDLLHLKDELTLVEAYVYIQQLRFKRPFEVEYRMEKELQYALVPKFSLQPLVENAIVHGFSELKNPGRITIRVHAINGSLVMEVEDNGIGLERAKRNPSSLKRNGIALINLQERLRLLYKEEASFELVSLPAGTLVRMSVPLLLSMPYRSEDAGGSIPGV